MMNKNAKKPFIHKSITAAVAFSLGQFPGLAMAEANKEFKINPPSQSVEATGGVASDAKGNFAATWVSDNGVVLRFYTPSGKPRGNSVTVPETDSAIGADIAMKADGQSAVAWTSAGLVSVQLLNAAGAAKGSPVSVASVADLNQETAPAVAMDGQGGFVVVWRDGKKVLAKTFDAAGAPKADIVVDESESDTEDAPSVAMDKQGGFVVVWPDDGVWFRRFDPNGNALGESDQVDTAWEKDDIDSTVSAPSVAMDADGDFIVAWAQEESSYSSSKKTTKGKCRTYKEYGETYTYCEDDSYTTTYKVNQKASVRARRYSKSAQPIGKEIEITKAASQYSYTSEDEQDDSQPMDGFAHTDIAMDAAGNFVVGWEFDKVKTIKGKCRTYKEYGETYTECDDDSHSTTSQIQARKYKANTKPNGAILLVAKDAAKTPSNIAPSVSLSGRGDVALTWTRPAGDAGNLFGRAYAKK